MSWKLTTEPCCNVSLSDPIVWRSSSKPVSNPVPGDAATWQQGSEACGTDRTVQKGAHLCLRCFLDEVLPLGQHMGTGGHVQSVLHPGVGSLTPSVQSQTTAVTFHFVCTPWNNKHTLINNLIQCVHFRLGQKCLFGLVKFAVYKHNNCFKVDLFNVSLD